MSLKNHVHLEFLSLPENVAFARTCAAAFATQLDCTLEELEEIKLVVSEAVSNSIIHGYGRQGDGKVVMELALYQNWAMEMVIIDHGRGIADVEAAMQPTYSTESERMGMGFVFMKSFTDHLEVESSPGQGTIVRMTRSFRAQGNRALA